jgi:C1A family cysteine protease
MKTVVALLVVLSFAAAFTQQEYEAAFTSWMVKYEKNYAPEEIFYRFEVFKSNMDFVEEWNNANHTSTVEMNKYADLTSAEFGMIYNGLKTELARGGKVATLSDLPQTYPSGSLDWRQSGAVTGVKDQGQCGSCWAFSTTGSMEGVIKIKHGVLTSLSEQALVDCSTSYGNMGCNGGLMDNAFKYAMAKGLPTEAAYPYTSGTTGKGGTCKAYTMSAYTQLTGYKDVTHTADALGAASDIEPVSVAIQANQPAFQLYKGGVITSGCGTNLDHGVLVAGYGTDASAGPYWLVKNSWGTSWGEAGYVRISRNNDVCGIDLEPSYPTD